MKTLQWLACKALKGMFPGELAVMVSTAEGRKLSLFVSIDCVRLKNVTIDELNGEEADAEVKVDLLDRDEEFGLVQLPTQPVDGPRVAKVSRQSLSA